LQFLETARGVDGIADRRQRRRAGVAHFADDGRSNMDADADAQRLIEVVHQRLVEIAKDLCHRLGCGDCLARTQLGAALDRQRAP